MPHPWTRRRLSGEERRKALTAAANDILAMRMVEVVDGRPPKDRPSRFERLRHKADVLRRKGKLEPFGEKIPNYALCIPRNMSYSEPDRPVLAAITPAALNAFRSRLLPPIHRGEAGSRSVCGLQTVHDHELEEVDSGVIERRRILLDLLNADWL